MLWVALLIPTQSEPLRPSSAALPASAEALVAKAGEKAATSALKGLALWCLQFTPRVAMMEECAVVMEVEGSLRLFKGLPALKARISAEAPDLGVTRIAWAPTAMAALVLARCGVGDLGDRLLQPMLDAQPLGALSSAAIHAETLTRIGINTLGQLRSMPRGGISRRFDADLLDALDQAYGLRAEVFQWEVVPDRFATRCELPEREDHAPALLMYARPLLMQMCGWLAARHSGAAGFRLGWAHDAMRSRDVEASGDLVVRSAEHMRDLEHFVRLLAENLAKLKLAAPVGELRLEALDVERITEQSTSLLPDSQRTGESLQLVLERIAARLGPERVRQAALVDDHRAEWMTHWEPFAKRRTKTPPKLQELPEPTFLLEEPLQLAVRDNRPQYQGPLLLLIGPDRMEAGWWDRMPETNQTRHVARDYWVACSETAGVLWIFCSKVEDGEFAWFLHGIFA